MVRVVSYPVAHNPKVAGFHPTPPTNAVSEKAQIGGLGTSRDGVRPVGWPNVPGLSTAGRGQAPGGRSGVVRSGQWRTAISAGHG